MRSASRVHDAAILARMSAHPTPRTIDDVVRELDACSAHARRLVDGLPAATIAKRSIPARWSVAEHVEHLNLATAAYLPIIEAAAVELRARDARSNGPYRTDLMGRFLLWMSEPPVRKRVPTTAPFVPGPDVDPSRVAARFDELQRALRARIPTYEGLALDRARVRSPFDPRIRYSAWSAIRLIPAHQRRHLWLAERVREAAVGG